MIREVGVWFIYVNRPQKKQRNRKSLRKWTREEIVALIRNLGGRMAAQDGHSPRYTSIINSGLPDP